MLKNNDFGWNICCPWRPPLECTKGKLLLLLLLSLLCNLWRQDVVTNIGTNIGGFDFGWCHRMAAQLSLPINEHVVDEVGSRKAAEAKAVVAACMMGALI